MLSNCSIMELNFWGKERANLDMPVKPNRFGALLDIDEPR